MFTMFKEKVNTMSMAEAKRELQNNKTIQLIDVRSREEYKEAHIPQSKNYPLDELAGIENKLKDKNQKLFVYCYSGARSKRACSLLNKMGYTDVTNIGGISQWTGQVERG